MSYRHSSSGVRGRVYSGKGKAPPGYFVAARAGEKQHEGASIRIFMRSNDVNSAIGDSPRADIRARQAAWKAEDRSAIMHSPAVEPESLADYAARVGVIPGVGLSDVDAQTVLTAIGDSASDLFVSRDAATSFLETVKFASGQTAFDLIAAGRAVSVLARLNELRFGTSG